MDASTQIDQIYSLFRTKLAAVAPDARVDDWNGVIHLTSWHGASLDHQLHLHVNRGLLAGLVWGREDVAAPMWPRASPGQAAINLLLEQIGMTIARRRDEEVHLHVSLSNVTSSRSRNAV